MDVVEKRALVSVGEIHTRIVKFYTSASIISNIRTAFAGRRYWWRKIFLFKNSKNGAGGMFFVDVEGDIPDKSILRVVRTSQVSV